jgi:hypothetical protein
MKRGPKFGVAARPGYAGKQDVRYGSVADVPAPIEAVRFVPQADMPPSNVAVMWKSASRSEALRAFGNVSHFSGRRQVVPTRNW